MTTTITPQDVVKIADLAHLSVTDDEKKKFAAGFTATLEVVDKLNTVDVSNIPPTHHPNGTVNAFRDDVVDEARMLTQTQALSNASHPTHKGYFVVDQVLDQE